MSSLSDTLALVRNNVHARDETCRVCYTIGSRQVIQVCHIVSKDTWIKAVRAFFGACRLKFIARQVALWRDYNLVPEGLVQRHAGMMDFVNAHDMEQNLFLRWSMDTYFSRR